MSVAHQPYPSVPARSVFSDQPALPGVYHSLSLAGNRWVFYALGVEGAILGCTIPRFHELDADVIERLAALVRDEARAPVLALVNGDAIRGAGLHRALHRPLCLPSLVRSLDAS